MNILLKYKRVRIMNHEVDEFVKYCNEHEVYPQGGAYFENSSGQIAGQFFYL